MNNADFKDTRILEAFDYIDPKYIAEVAESLKLRSVKTNTPAPEMTWRTPFKHWKQFVALAACLILLSFASPIANYVVEAVRSFAAGRGSVTTEVLTDTINSEFIDSEFYITHSLNQTDVDNVNSAYKKYWRYDKGVFWNSLEEVTFAKGERCTYGKYNDCIVIARRTEMDFVETIIVNEYEFVLPACFLWVCKDEQLYDLSSAYKNGWLNDEEIKCIYEIHNNYIWGHLKKSK